MTKEHILKSHEKKMERIRLNNEYLILKQQRKTEINKYKKKFQKTKVIVGWIFLNCTIVEIYSMIVMFYLQDLSALVTLISTVVTEAIAFAIYSVKAYNETKQEETMKFEREKFNADCDTEKSEAKG